MLAREHELAAAAAVADSLVDGRGRILDITGGAGMGKSTLLAELIDRLGDTGIIVWSHAATPPEQELSWTGLATLLDGVATDTLAALPPGHRAHLDTITAPNASTAVQPHGVAIALRELIAAASSAGPLAIVLDDENWLDASTAGAITFVTRSIADHPVVIVLSRRSDERSSIDTSAVAHELRHQIDLHGLPVDAVAELVGPIVGRSANRSTIKAVHESAAGNPMLAIEIARQLAAGEPLDRALLPRSIVESLAPRLAALPGDCRQALGYASLLAVASTDVIGAALGADALVAVGPAESAGLIEVHTTAGTSTIRFTHPTIAAAALAHLATADFRAAHARLATLVDDPESRGVHLAASVPDVGIETAATLETAAELADRRGAADAASRLYRASVDATPADRAADRHRRLMALAHVQSIGLMHRDLLSTLTEITPQPGTVDADRVITMRVAARSTCESLEAARGDALASIDAVTTAKGRLFALSQIVLLERLDDLRRGLAAAERAVDDARRSGDAEAIETATLSLAVGRVLVGEPVDITAAIAPAEVWDESMHLGNAMEELVQLLWFAGDPRGVSWAERMWTTAATRGDVVTEVNAVGYRGEMLVTRGDWAAAELALRGSLHGHSDTPERATLGYLQVSTGAPDEVYATLLALDAHEATRGRVNTFHVSARQAMAAFTRGEPDAVDRLEIAHQLATSIGLRAPRLTPFRRDYVEALVGAGRLDDARVVADEMVAIADHCGLDSAGADAAAALAVCAAAVGEDQTAAELFNDAAKIHDRDGDRYELARTLLAAGTAARRANRRRDARHLFDEAAAHFATMGAEPWLTRCHAEAARIGGRPRRTTTLSATERQIAALAASGQTNAEIAAAMFVSVRTVESNLSRCYQKLGIRSRAELTTALAALAD